MNNVAGYDFSISIATLLHFGRGKLDEGAAGVLLPAAFPPATSRAATTVSETTTAAAATATASCR